VVHEDELTSIKANIPAFWAGILTKFHFSSQNSNSKRDGHVFLFSRRAKVATYAKNATSHLQRNASLSRTLPSACLPGATSSAVAIGCNVQFPDFANLQPRFRQILGNRTFENHLALQPAASIFVPLVSFCSITGLCPFVPCEECFSSIPPSAASKPVQKLIFRQLNPPAALIKVSYVSKLIVADGVVMSFHKASSVKKHPKMCRRKNEPNSGHQQLSTCNHLVRLGQSAWLIRFRKTNPPSQCSQC
jgi:hypothetical protein